MDNGSSERCPLFRRVEDKGAMPIPAPPSLASRLAGVATKRFRLVPLGLQDRGELSALTDDPTITGAIDFLPSPFTVEAAERLIRLGLGERDSFLGIRGKDDDQLIGVVGAHLRGDDDIEIGYWIGGAFRGRGVATEAASGLVAFLTGCFPARRLVAECRPENRASWRILIKIGFRPTGTPGMRPGRSVLSVPR